MIDYTKERISQRLDWWLVRVRRQLPLPRAWHLRRDVRHINQIYVRFIANATGQEREHLAAEWAFERTLIDERHRGLETERLQKKADRFYVPLPVLSSDTWERGPTGTWYLTPEGAEKVRSAIYEERKRRREIWVPWIAAAVGVLGTVTGLILALQKG
jgi:cation diffusion facilitator CzcD-associated flavoprotein CzcO